MGGLQFPMPSLGNAALGVPCLSKIKLQISPSLEDYLQVWPNFLQNALLSLLGSNQSHFLWFRSWSRLRVCSTECQELDICGVHCKGEFMSPVWNSKWKHHCLHFCLDSASQPQCQADIAEQRPTPQRIISVLLITHDGTYKRGLVYNFPFLRDWEGRKVRSIAALILSCGQRSVCPRKPIGVSDILS